MPTYDPALASIGINALKQLVEALENTQNLSEKYKQLYWSHQKAILKLLCRLRLNAHEIVELGEVQTSFRNHSYGERLEQNQRVEVIRFIGAAMVECQHPNISVANRNADSLLDWIGANRNLGESTCKRIRNQLSYYDGVPDFYSHNLNKLVFRALSKCLLGMSLSELENDIIPAYTNVTR